MATSDHTGKSATVVASGAPSWRQKLKPLIVSVFIILGGAGLSYAVWIAAQNAGYTPHTDMPGVLGNGNGDYIDKSYRQADDLQAQGKYSDAKQLLLNAISSSDASLSAKGYRHLTAIALNAQAFDDALFYGKKSYDLEARTDTAQMVAVAAEQKGDKATAKAYYQKALDKLVVADGDEQAKATADNIKTKLAELSK